MKLYVSRALRRHVHPRFGHYTSLLIHDFPAAIGLHAGRAIGGLHAAAYAAGGVVFTAIAVGIAAGGGNIIGCWLRRVINRLRLDIDWLRRGIKIEAYVAAAAVAMIMPPAASMPPTMAVTPAVAVATTSFGGGAVAGGCDEGKCNGKCDERFSFHGCYQPKEMDV